jgi:hypothetical protein
MVIFCEHIFYLDIFIGLHWDSIRYLDALLVFIEFRMSFVIYRSMKQRSLDLPLNRESGSISVVQL